MAQELVSFYGLILTAILQAIGWIRFVDVREQVEMLIECVFGKGYRALCLSVAFLMNVFPRYHLLRQILDRIASSDEAHGRPILLCRGQSSVKQVKVIERYQIPMLLVLTTTIVLLPQEMLAPS